MVNILEKYREEISRCMHCGLCQAVCPSYKETLDETMVARGRLSLIEAVLEKQIKLTPNLSNKLNSCLECLACVENCPTGVNPAKIINAAKTEYFKEKGIEDLSYLFLVESLKKGWPLYPLGKLVNWGAKNIFPFFSRLQKNLPDIAFSHLRRELPEIIPAANPKIRVAFFSGCMTDLVYQKSGMAAIEILKKNNIEIIIPRNQLCCGIPCKNAGDRENAIYLARQNINIFDQLPVDFIITTCSTCSSMLKKGYPVLLGEELKDFTAKITDIHSFIKNNPEINTKTSIKVSAQKKIKVTYHDPCHLKRELGIFSEPRGILKNIPGVEFVEMQEADGCCGGAGLFSFKYYDLSMAIARRKFENIINTGAEIVVTPCPSCRMQITDILIKHGRADIKVMHTLELLTDTRARRGDPMWSP